MSKVLKWGPSVHVEAASLVIPVVEPPVQTEEVAATHESMDEPLPSPEELWAVAQAQVAQMLQDAEARAQQMVNAALDEAAAIREQAYNEGREDGVSDGKAEAFAACEQEVARRLESAAEIVQSAKEHRRHLIRDLHQPLTAIAMFAVKAILARELSLAPADIEGIVSEIIESAADISKVEVRVHPQDYHLAVEAHPTWRQSRFGEWELVIVPDATVTAGGCEVRFDSGRADATVETKLAMLQDALSTSFERSVSEDVSAVSE